MAARLTTGVLAARTALAGLKSRQTVTSRLSLAIATDRRQSGGYMRRWVPLLVLVLAAGWTLPALAEKRVALVIGINDYDNLRADQQLKKAVNDGKAVGDALTAIGFEVLRAENVGRLEFNRVWQRFLNRLEPGDTAAFFFAGHGVEVAGSNFLLARDVPRVASGEDDLLKGETIALSRLLDDLRGRRPKMSLLILDACRDNPFPQPGGRSVGGTRGLARVEAPEGTFVMFSAGTGEAALDRLDAADADANSVYTRWLIRLMPQPGLSLPDLAQELRRRVRELAASVRHRQTPAYYDEVVGRYCLGGCEGGGSPSASLAVPPELARPAPPAPKIEAPNEPLPTDVSVNPAILKLIETHPFFANAPPVFVGTYSVDQTTVIGAGVGSSTSTGSDETNVRWLRPSIVKSEINQKITVSNSAGTMTSTSRTALIYAANGLFSLGSRVAVQNRFGTTTVINKLLRLENLRGQLFPVQIGNRFSYDTTEAITSKDYNDEITQLNSCEVLTRYDARRFHSNLDGPAYLVGCKTEQSYKKNRQGNGQAQSKILFIERLGVWINADPISPREQIILNGAISTVGNTTVTSNGTYLLRSFSLVR